MDGLSRLGSTSCKGGPHRMETVNTWVIDIGYGRGNHLGQEFRSSWVAYLIFSWLPFCWPMMARA